MTRPGDGTLRIPVKVGIPECAKKDSAEFGEVGLQLRHAYASHLAQAGVDLLTISKVPSHAGTRITARHYAHPADKTLAAAVTKLPSLTATKSPALRQVKTA